jgi:hypothetical protein
MIISLAEWKAHADVSGSTYDTTLTIYANALTEFLERKIGRKIEQGEVTEYFDGDNIKDTIFLSNFPVASTPALTLQYRSGSYSSPTWNNFDPDDYQVDADSGMIYCDAMFSGIRNIKVVYTAGWSSGSMPNSLKLAALKMMTNLWNKRRSDGFTSEEAGGARIEWDKLFNSDIENLIAPYRKANI